MTPPDLPPPSLRVRFDSDALAHNWRALRRMAGVSTGAAVKADAYGLGAASAVPVLRDLGVEDFFVAHWSEAPGVLRHAGGAAVWVLHGPLNADDARFARQTGAMPVINSLPQARLWIESGGGPCGLMADTGMNRLGLSPADAGDPLVARLEIDTLFSHLASADEDTAQNERQLTLFRSVAAQVPARRRSLANSAGIALGPRYAFDAVRPGLALYGGVPRAEFDSAIRQVAYPQAAVLQVRALSAGDGVGYNATFTAPCTMRAATVSLGYADGFLRCRAAGGALWHGDTRLPLLGKISMDMVVVDCSDAPSLREGDWLDVPFSLPEASRECGLSQYELLTTLGRRFRRT